MRAFIIAMEYRGKTLGTGEGAPRVPVCEHAYDLETATLAGHPAGQLPRIGFPARQRGWNSQPETARCPDCDTIMQRIVRDLITAAVSSGPQLTGSAPAAATRPADPCPAATNERRLR